MKTLYVTILGIALVILAIYGISITNSRNALKTELAKLQVTLNVEKANLTGMKYDLDSTKQSLSKTTANLVSAEKTLASTQTELESTKKSISLIQTDLTTTTLELSSTQDELTQTKKTLDSVQQTSANLSNNLAMTKQQLKVAQDTLDGLGITLSSSSQCRDVLLVDNITATNPSWNQLVAFLSKDQTQNHTYITDVYDCSQFSRDLHNNAELAGIRAAEVQIWFKYEITGHALNAFLTTDCGLVYVDSVVQDTIARVKVGKEYRAVEPERVRVQNIRNDSWWDSLGLYFYIPSSFLGFLEIGVETKSINIFW
jgi:hypothetical protein